MVAEAQQPALGLYQQVLAQQGGLRSDAISHMDKVTGEAGRLPKLLRRDGKIDLQAKTPLVCFEKNWYTNHIERSIRKML
ncbi:hypothetical protein SDC9_152343 [bioreactor metagenome]|uniref:Uncharacterized protein n=1 Tax=bioreactor metagenome TaxID=1076179 RepID=A0A645EX72_9ZZZZ